MRLRGKDCRKLAGALACVGGAAEEEQLPTSGQGFTDSWTFDGSAWSPLTIGYGPSNVSGAVIAVP
jgi:hypothetical protein